MSPPPPTPFPARFPSTFFDAYPRKYKRINPYVSGSVVDRGASGARTDQLEHLLRLTAAGITGGCRTRFV